MTSVPTTPTVDDIDWGDQTRKTAPPCTSPTALAVLLGRIQQYLQRYVVLSKPQGVAVTLWVAHTHTLEAADCTPYLHITAATKRAGKTRLLEVLEPIVARPWKTDRVTAAVLVRKIDAEQPTLLLDESDAALTVPGEYSETLRGLLNSGYRRSGRVSLCVGQGANLTYKDFSTFAAKAIAGIGTLPDTVADRSIQIMLRRRTKSERVARWREREGHAEAEPLVNELVPWGDASVRVLADARPELLEETLDDRAADVWEPLLAIADLAGDEWPAMARHAAKTLSTTADETEPVVELLRDIQELFRTSNRDTVASRQLLQHLVALEDRPWREHRRGLPLTARGLAQLLGQLNIHPRRLDTDDGRLRAYPLDAFSDAFARYLPS